MELTIENLSANYGGVDVLSAIDAHVESGKLLSVVGPSGSGKSTFLRALAGLVPPRVTGDIAFDGRSVMQESPKHRNVGFVFQDLALYPHLRVSDNISLAVRFMPTPKGRQSNNDTVQRVRAVATRLGIGEYLERYPHQLSGGQQQRAAIARAIVRAPNLNLLLLDEPFSGLDPMLRASTRDLIRSLHQDLGITTICVTHDRIEALTISDRLLVLRDGRLQQLDTPDAILDRPANAFVASFVGEAPLNYYTADGYHNSHPVLRFAGIELPLPPSTAQLVQRNNQLTVGVRPESISQSHDYHDHSAPHVHNLSLPVVKRELLGERALVETTTPDNSVLRFLTSRRFSASAKTATVCIALRDVLVFDAAERRVDLS